MPPNKEKPFKADDDLIEQVKAGAPWAYRSWEPADRLIVLGRSNQIETEVHEPPCQVDRIPILRRRGGGGTVVLSPGILVISLCKCVKQRYHSQHYFTQINQVIIAALETLGIQHLTQQGHSDICLRDRKILGAAIYQSHDVLFYTASLMVANSIDLIDRYLKHPSKEPEYRRGRSHREFLTTIIQEYPEMDIESVKRSIDTLFSQRVAEIE